jgi:hypothetical protein
MGATHAQRRDGLLGCPHDPRTLPVERCDLYTRNRIKEPSMRLRSANSIR